MSQRVSAQDTLNIVLARLDDMKAEDTVTIDLTGKSSIGDFMVVTSGRSQRHVASIADHVIKDLEQSGAARVRVEGMTQGDWVLIDAGRPEVRAFYNLEKMWSGRHADGRKVS